ncbi:MAG TPA: hypothetical protein VFU63_02560 [Ktedonobacterales bacterium]|nr:hypothetical protein [Ktedonobacterales bacterium]
MARPRRKRNALGTLAVALLLLALAVALFLLAPRAIDTSQATQIPTPGQVTLPPTAPVVVTATSK